MKPFIVLLVVFGVSVLGIQLFFENTDWKWAGRIAMSIMLFFTSIGHFKYTKGMTMMLPDRFPAKTFFVYFTGIVEIVAGIGFLIPYLTKLTGWLVILFFILMTPADVYAAIHKVDFEKANNEGKGVEYLWFRVPLQVLFIIWVMYFMQ